MPDSNNHLEPRVAAIEAQLATLTTDVSSLVTAVREQSKQIGSLAVEVSTAKGPRKTEWSVMIGAIALFMSIGAAALSPLYLRMGDMQLTQQGNSEKFEVHEKLRLHPVGSEKIDALEKDLQNAVLRREVATAALASSVEKDIKILRDEAASRAVGYTTQIEQLRDKTIPPLNERIAVMDQRVKELESRNPQVRFQLQPIPGQP